MAAAGEGEAAAGAAVPLAAGVVDKEAGAVDAAAAAAEVAVEAAAPVAKAAAAATGAAGPNSAAAAEEMEVWVEVLTEDAADTASRAAWQMGPKICSQPVKTAHQPFPLARVYHQYYTTPYPPPLPVLHISSELLASRYTPLLHRNVAKAHTLFNRCFAGNMFENVAIFR